MTEIRDALISARGYIAWLIARQHGKSQAEMEQYYRDFPDACPQVIAQIDTVLEQIRKMEAA